MGRCYYLKNENFVKLDAVLNLLQKVFDDKKCKIKLIEFNPSEVDGGLYYMEGESTRGVQLTYENDSIVVRLNVLCNVPDYIIAKFIMYLLSQSMEKDFVDKKGNVINPEEYFTEANIQDLMEKDAKTVMSSLIKMEDRYITIPGIVRNVYLGRKIVDFFSDKEASPGALVKIFETLINYVQYELPDYDMPGAALIRPKDSQKEEDFIKIRMMFEGNPYILQDYDYLMIRADENEKEIIFINNEDLLEIAPKVFDKDSGYSNPDDFTVVFPKLEGDSWKRFVDLAREKNHKELLEAQSVTKPVNLTPDYNPETDEKDEDSYQCHGNHWDCVLADLEKEFAGLLKTAVENASVICGEVETDYNLDEGIQHGRIAELEYSEKPDDEISIRLIISHTEESNQLISMYPCVKAGVSILLKITEITEWQNGVEAWIRGELADGRSISFFDANYAVNKDKYKIDEQYNFVIGALAYNAKEPESKGFSFEGQKAIDFKAKLGEAPEYDEDGNVKPIYFSTETLCALFQTSLALDDAEYITTVEDIKTVSALGKSFWKFDTLYRSEDDGDLKIPTFVLKSEKNKALDKATQIQGVLWLTGYLAEVLIK